MTEQEELTQLSEWAIHHIGILAEETVKWWDNFKLTIDGDLSQLMYKSIPDKMVLNMAVIRILKPIVAPAETITCNDILANVTKSAIMYGGTDQLAHQWIWAQMMRDGMILGRGITL